jgi:membrane protease YdiL (CAAX protease family)
VFLNDLVPYFGIHILHQGPISGNPLASTVIGTVIIQLLDTLIAIGSIFVLTKASGKELSSVYAQNGKFGMLLVLSIIAFLIIGIISARHTSHFIPTNGVFTLDRYLALTPALLVLVISNGLQEEFLFRGLFLEKYESFFSATVSIVLQAIVFSIAHLGISYTPSAAIFTFLFVFPLGLITGFLMHTTKGVTAPAIFHAGVDIPIYLAFLSYVS